jgi:hypothetical protein
LVNASPEEALARLGGKVYLHPFIKSLLYSCLDRVKVSDR